MRIANLYAGLGGNRKLWEGHEVTAIENNPEIAKLYKSYYPNDIVIIADAHEYLLKHYNDFDFIWGSPVCPTHSRARMWTSKGGRYPVKYPDMSLYQEIILLKHFREKPWVIENVIPYYEPLIKPTVKLDRHYIWSNFDIVPAEFIRNDTQVWATTSTTKNFGFDISDVKIKHRKDQIIRNIMNPEIGLYILNSIPL